MNQSEFIQEIYHQLSSPMVPDISGIMGNLYGRGYLGEGDVAYMLDTQHLSIEEYKHAKVAFLWLVLICEGEEK